MWLFMMPNERITQPLFDFLIPTTKLEQFADVKLWNRLEGTEIEKEKISLERFGKK